MKKFLCVLCVLCGSALAQLRPVHTFSIVARDPATGQIGVAVQSHWFAVGQIVPWAEAGVGAVATQSFVDPSYGPLGLGLMRAGKSAPEALHALLQADAHRNVRQVAFLDAAGNLLSFTGAKDIQPAGCASGGGAANEEDYKRNFAGPQKVRDEWGYYCTGKDFAVQANLMSNDRIWPAMAKAFQESKGDLAERMLAALDAAQAVGGDIRGRQSAALIVVEGKRQNAPWEGRIFDLRVDDAAEPLQELRRLVALQRAYNHMNAGDLAVEHKDNEAALREYAAAEEIASHTEGVLPSRLAEMIYWHAVALVNMQRLDQALPLFRKVFAMDKNWATLTPRVAAAGLLPDDPKLMERIVGTQK